MAGGGGSKTRLGRLHDVMAGHVEYGGVPGLVALVSRRGDTHVDAIGTLAAGGHDPIRRDTIFRIASMTKPVAAAAAMILVEECRLRLDDPIDAFVPELANRRVLRRPDGPVDDTVPAHRPLTLRDLLTLRMGLGYVFDPDPPPVMAAANALGLLTGPPRPQSQPAPDEWIRRLGTLPLLHQPGEAWMYDIGLDVLGVLIARVAGRPLDVFLRERLFEPLGMKDTGFHVPHEKLGRFTTSYWTDPATGKTAIYDAAEGGEWSRPPAFPASASGLVSTVDDYLAFAQMLLDGGRCDGERILSRPSVELMTGDQLTPEQRAGGRMILDGAGWGFGLSVTIRRDDVSATPGRYGWDGGLGTSWRNDPREGLIGILLTSRSMEGPSAPPVYRDFWTSAYQALDD